MDRLEGRLNFVGYNMLVNQWMLDWGIAWNEHECRKLVDAYQQACIVLQPHMIEKTWYTSLAMGLPGPGLMPPSPPRPPCCKVITLGALPQ